MISLKTIFGIVPNQGAFVAGLQGSGKSRLKAVSLEVMSKAVNDLL